MTIAVACLSIVMGYIVAGIFFLPFFPLKRIYVYHFFCWPTYAVVMLLWAKQNMTLQDQSDIYTIDIKELLKDHPGFCENCSNEYPCNRCKRFKNAA